MKRWIVGLVLALSLVRPAPAQTLEDFTSWSVMMYMDARRKLLPVASILTNLDLQHVTDNGNTTNRRIVATGGLDVAGGPIYFGNCLQTTGSGTVATYPASVSPGERGANAIDLQVARYWDSKVAYGSKSALLGGANNRVGASGVVCGGEFNTAEGFWNAIVGGFNNQAGLGPGNIAFVGGGTLNKANGQGAVVCGGESNDAGAYGAIVGGKNNLCGTLAGILGGEGNKATGYGSLAAGRNAWATHDGSVVYRASGAPPTAVIGDDGSVTTHEETESFADDSITVVAPGGMRFLNTPLLLDTWLMMPQAFTAYGACTIYGSLDVPYVPDLATGEISCEKLTVNELDWEPWAFEAQYVTANGGMYANHNEVISHLAPADSAAFTATYTNSDTTTATQERATTAIFRAPDATSSATITTARTVAIEAPTDGTARNVALEITGGSTEILNGGTLSVDGGIDTTGTVTAQTGALLGSAAQGCRLKALAGSMVAVRSWDDATTGSLGVGAFVADSLNYYASGSNVAQHKFAAPSSGTNRYTAWFDSPSGGTINQSIYAAGGVVVGGAVQSTASGGNARGARATDLQPSRNDASLVASGADSVIAGGASNKASGAYDAVLGGNVCYAMGTYSFALGGYSQVASGVFSGVLQGRQCTASGIYSLAAGRRAKATQSGSFVFADGTDADFTSPAPNSFNVRATDGARFTHAIQAGGPIETTGNISTSATVTCAATTATTAIRQGDATNNTTLDQRGVTFAGQNKPWEDLRVSALAGKLTGAADPNFAQFKDGTYTYWFAKNTTNTLVFTAQFPHGWDGGTIQPHLHWVPKTDGAAQAVKWALEYTWAEIGATFGPTTTIAATATSPSDSTLAAYKHYLTAFPAVTPTTSQDGLSSILVCSIHRVGADAADTYDDVAGLLEVDFHYQISSIGSQDELTK